jgi:hypothetical protein
MYLVNKRRIIVTIFAVIFTFVAIGAYIVIIGNRDTSGGRGLGIDLNRIENSVQNRERPEASISTSIESTEISDDSFRSLNVVLDAQGEKLAGIALRLVYNYSQEAPLNITDANLEKEGVQVKPDSDLVNAGWVYPVNEVYTDSSQGKVFVDVALVNLNPEGYTPDSKLTVASFEFSADKTFSNKNFAFDSEETKVLTKDARSLNLDLNEASFNVE